ncbi:serine/threonine protein phosphatase [Thioalkalivibrio denitrificans]|uniref:Serine/threonine protein phosphatase n=1 Tax=Thioalkalivibrio denitrificans TaxID=108003 RepID=A0A1V3NK00_9GAMM|nr:PP2C family protein-serine/threonine phosphatase [Thioalkalivibrio denitrificans]OOG25228.1 serine/threonine protein phosphatase [Thioalkalivibrio denitrificans]
MNDSGAAERRIDSHIPFTRSLTFRQAAVTLLIVALLGLLGGVVELGADWRSMRAEIQENTLRSLELVRGSASQAAFQFNDDLAAQVVDGLFAHREMESVVLRDNFGGVLTRRDREDTPPAGAVVSRLFGDITDYSVDLRYGAVPEASTDVGALEVTLAAGEIGARFTDRGLVIFVVGLIKAVVISALVVLIFYFMITRPLIGLHTAITRIDPVRPGDWPRPRFPRHERDELGQIVSSLDHLMQAFQQGLEQRDRARDENMRLGAELDVSRRIQHILLPSRDELDAIEGLDIATHMEPAQEVGGDYYDILSHDEGVRIGIGDVTGHGLESGVVMLMTQSAVRTLLTSREQDMVRVMDVINTTIYNNVQRMGCGKNLTLALLDYRRALEGSEPGVRGHINISGQHETVIIARRDGSMEVIDTDELGFPIGLVEEMAHFVGQISTDLHEGDVVVLYTDGITEAADEQNRLYGQDRLLEVIARHRDESAESIKDTIINDVKRHMGNQILYDDLTLVILKQK